MVNQELIVRADEGKRFYEALLLEIERTKAELNGEERLELYLCSGINGPILVTSMGYSNPSMIMVDGRDAVGEQVKVLANWRSVQVCMKIKGIGKSGNARSKDYDCAHRDH